MKKATFVLVAMLALGMQARADRRPMLEQGKTWYYTYHHYEADAHGYDDEHTTWTVYYLLHNDTTIAGQKYMKMYRRDNIKNRYFGAFREDEEGRVYMVRAQTDEGEQLIIDFNLNYENAWVKDVQPIVETINVKGQTFHRYKYKDLPDIVGVEGVGFLGVGLNSPFVEHVNCICDYESFESVRIKGVEFKVADFESPKEIPLTAEEKRQVERNNDFAFNLFREARVDRSQVLSPLSITYALGMLNNGAAGQTQQEINQVLGFGDAEAMNNFCRKMLTESSDVDKNTKVMIGNTIFVNHGYELQEAFKEKANTFYDANPESRDFADEKTMGVINQWASDHTEGMIDRILSPNEFTPDAVSYLLNAIYFKGAWRNKFLTRNTREEVFKSGEKVKMMYQQGRFEYTENDLFQAIRLPYGNGGYRMDVLLPREDKSLDDLLPQLNGSDWLFNGKMWDVDLKLPRFETDTNVDLKPVMSALGMPLAFDRNRAEFPYFCNWPIFIDKMKQAAKIKLDEEGTEAAAVTSNELPASASTIAKFHANRPFLYIISEQSTGAIFFIGQFMGDVTAKIAQLSTNTPNTSSTYDLQGRRMSECKPLQPGIYVKDGRKFVVK